jgi:S1-C subfamily serine protease
MEGEPVVSRISHRPDNASATLKTFSLMARLSFCLLLSPPPSFAADPSILDLQRDLTTLFPPSPVATHTPSRSPPDSPHTIIEREFLLTRTPDIERPSTKLSLRQIRSAPAAIKNAHAACVRIITPYWQGAGVLISPSGDILTSHHLIAGVPCVSVQTIDGHIYTVTNITAASATHDLALINITGGPFPFLSAKTNPDPSRGTALHIVGHPGNNPWKLANGSVIRRTFDRGTEILHFDADVARGNSGGPIVDDAGRLLAITACSATLADGSTVKVGIAAPAIRAFLAEPRLPRDFADISRIERNRRMAEFLGQLYVMMDAWIADWLASMSQVTLERADGLPETAPLAKARFANARQAYEKSAKLLLLKTLMLRCTLVQDLDSPLIASIAGSTATLDAIMDGSLLLGSGAGATPQEAAAIIARLNRCKLDAEKHFGEALATVQTVSTRLELNITDPQHIKQLADIGARYNSPAGCRVKP